MGARLSSAPPETRPARRRRSPDAGRDGLRFTFAGIDDPSFAPLGCSLAATVARSLKSVGRRG